jgi:hypothetical protein
MNLPRKPSVPEPLFLTCHKFSSVTACACNFVRAQGFFFGLLALTWPLAGGLAQSSPSPQQPPTQQSSTQTQPPAQAQSGSLDAPPQKQDSLVEAARKAKEKKPPAAKGKVYTEDDLSGLKGPGVSVVGDAPKKGARRTPPTDPDGDGGANNEQYWRERARQILDAIGQTDEQIAQKKDEIKKLGSGGFDVTTGFNQNVAYINDRNGQLKQLEQHKVDLQKQLDDLADEGRKAGAPASWFR